MADQLTYRQHARAVLALGLPLVGSHLAQFGIHMTDTIMLGWHNVDELAAVVLAGAYWFTIFIFGAGFGIALMPIVAAAATSGDEVEVRRTTRMALWLSVLFGALVMPLILLAEPILLSIGQNPTIAKLSGTYLQIAGWSIFPALGVMVIKSFLAALERTQVVLWTTVAGVGLNAVINYALIFGHWGAPELGLRGAAYASISVNVFTFLLLCFYAAWAEPQHELFKRLWRPDWAGFSRVFRLGLPIGLTNLAEIGLFSAAAILMGWLGTNELAAHGIAIQIASVTFMVHLGLSNAATIRAGQAYGKRDEAALRRGGLVAIGMSGLFSVVTMAVFFAFPEQLTGLFIDPADPRRPDIIPVAAALLLFAAFFQLADGGQVMILGLLRGVQDTKVPMYMAAFSYWAVAMPASYLLGFTFGFGANGVWAGLVIGLAVAAVFMAFRFWGRSVRIGG